VTEDETSSATGDETVNGTGSIVITGTDEVTAGVTSTAELPTFTPLGEAQVAQSPTPSAPLSLIGTVAAVAGAALLIMMRKTRR